MSCVLRAFWMVIAVLICAPVLAQSYPVKPIRLIVPFAPGGSTDLMGRLLGERIGTALGQQVIVDNRGGAGTRIGTELAARAPGDGYNLLITNIAFSINAGLHRNLAYDPRKDFSGVILLASQPTVLAAHPSLPVRSVQDVIRLARSRPGEVSFASFSSLSM
jgi:tripartite-type tricarboxylate transporter receptor subunit TctC